MELTRKRLFVVTVFLSIFFVKMVISVAPVFVGNLDRVAINNVIMQVEVEHGSDSETGKTMKIADMKATVHFYEAAQDLPLRYHFYVDNQYIEHFKRYINPFHPSVPTPPPNLV